MSSFGSNNMAPMFTSPASHAPNAAPMYTSPASHAPNAPPMFTSPASFAPPSGYPYPMGCPPMPYINKPAPVLAAATAYGTTAGVVLVLFILLVIISRAFL